MMISSAIIDVIVIARSDSDEAIQLSLLWRSWIASLRSQ
jgi:hypothetical protein